MCTARRPYNGAGTLTDVQRIRKWALLEYHKLHLELPTLLSRIMEIRRTFHCSFGAAIDKAYASTF